MNIPLKEQEPDVVIQGTVLQTNPKMQFMQIPFLQAHLGGCGEGKSDERRLVHGVFCSLRRPCTGIQGAIRDAGYHLGGELLVALSMALHCRHSSQSSIWDLPPKSSKYLSRVQS